MDYVVPQEAVYAGLRDTFWPGRLEVIGQDPVVILDCARQWGFRHASRREPAAYFFRNRSVTLILGVSQDKDKTGICRELDSITQTVIAARRIIPAPYWFTDDELKHFLPANLLSG